VTGLKSVIYYLNGHGMNNQTPRKGKNFKKGKHIRIFASPWSLIIRTMANQKQKNALISIML
jgi:hypothetical protein